MARIPHGILYPGVPPMPHVYSGTPNMQAINGLTEDGTKVCMVGYVLIPGGGQKTLSSDGGKIWVRISQSSFSGALRVGVQDTASSGTVRPLAPDGTFDVYGDYTGGDPTADMSGVAMSSGSKTLSDGQLVAVVLDLVSKTTGTISPMGLDSFAPGLPFVNVYDGEAWGDSAEAILPNVLFEFDDGSYGTLSGATAISGGGAYFYDGSDNPDERALLFQVPFACKVSGLALMCMGSAYNSNFNLRLYQNPLSSPQSIAALTLSPGRWLAPAMSLHRFSFSADVELEADRDYAIGLQATGSTGTVWMSYYTLTDEAHRAVHPGGATVRGGYRNNGSGAFTEVTTAIPLAQIVITEAGGGGGVPMSRVRLGM